MFRHCPPGVLPLEKIRLEANNESSMNESVYDAVRLSEDGRRKFRRYPVNLSALVKPLAAPDADSADTAARLVQRPAVVIEISMTGVVFVSPGSYSLNSVVELQITLGAISYTVQALVRRCDLHPLPGRRAFACSVQFVRGEHISQFVPAIAKYILRLPV